MENYLKSIRITAVSIIKEKDNYNFEEYLRNAGPSGTVRNISVNLKYIKNVFNSFEKLREDLTGVHKGDSLTLYKIKAFKEALNGNNDSGGLIKSLGMFFNRWDFEKGKLDKKKFADFFETCVNLMVKDVKIDNNTKFDVSEFDADTQKYFDLRYVQGLILNEINKYKNDEDLKLLDYGTVFFCDETKFSVNDGDMENAIFYFGIAMPPEKINKIHYEFISLLAKHKVQAPEYHSKNIFGEKRIREALMFDIASIIIENKLHIFCVKYQKDLLFETTKILSYLNNDVLKFDKPEFQALFYFLIILNTQLRDSNTFGLEPDYSMYFDRNVYGFDETEVFDFPHSEFVIKIMTFTKSSNISLIALADYVGYIFRKAKINYNEIQTGQKTMEATGLKGYCYANLLRIHQEGLFHFVDAANEVETFKKAFEYLSNND